MDPKFMEEFGRSINKTVIPVQKDKSEEKEKCFVCGELATEDYGIPIRMKEQTIKNK